MRCSPVPADVSRASTRLHGSSHDAIVSRSSSAGSSLVQPATASKWRRESPAAQTRVCCPRSTVQMLSLAYVSQSSPMSPQYRPVGVLVWAIRHRSGRYQRHPGPVTKSGSVNALTGPGPSREPQCFVDAEACGCSGSIGYCETGDRCRPGFVPCRSLLYCAVLVCVSPCTLLRRVHVILRRICYALWRMHCNP